MVIYYKDNSCDGIVVKVEDGVAMIWNYAKKKWIACEVAEDIARDIYNHVEIGDGDAEIIIQEYEEKRKNRIKYFCS